MAKIRRNWIVGNAILTGFIIVEVILPLAINVIEKKREDGIVTIILTK